MDLTVQMIIVIAVISFLCEYMDATLGMGYGTTLTPLFMLMGFIPGQIVPAILVSQLVCGFLASFFHHAEGNVNFRPHNRDVLRVHRIIHPVTYFKSVKQSFPMHLKMALLLGICSVFGAVSAIYVAINIPPFWLKLYIGVLVLSMGILILVMFNRKLSFSLWKITGLGMLASFNKCLSGGGYGPVITAGANSVGGERQERDRHHRVGRRDDMRGRRSDVLFRWRQTRRLDNNPVDCSGCRIFRSPFSEKRQIYPGTQVKSRDRHPNDCFRRHRPFTAF